MVRGRCIEPRAPQSAFLIAQYYGPVENVTAQGRFFGTSLMFFMISVFALVSKMFNANMGLIRKREDLGSELWFSFAVSVVFGFMGYLWDEWTSQGAVI